MLSPINRSSDQLIPTSAAGLSTAAAQVQFGAALAAAQTAQATMNPKQTLASSESPAATQPSDPKSLSATKARKIAGDLVSHALILPILKQLRRSPFSKDPLFGGGIGEKTFGPEFDMQLSDRIAHSPKMQVTDALARRLLKVQRPAPLAPGAADKQPTGVDVHG